MKRLLITLGITAVLLTLIFLIGPIIGKNYFNKHSEEIIGRKATIEKLSVNPFRGSVTVDQFNIYEKESPENFSGWKQLYINVNLLKLITGNLQAEEIRLDSPYVHIINDRGVFNFDDLVAEDTLSTSEKDSTTEPINFEILNLRMNKGLITYYETSVDHLINMDNLSFSLPKFAWNSNSAEMDLNFIINDSGLLTIQNSFFPDENSFICHTKLTNLDLGISRPYSHDYIDISEYSGKMGFDINIKGKFADTSYLTITGTSWITKLVARDTATTPMLSVDSAAIDIREIDVFNEQFLFKKLYVKNPKIRFDVIDSTNNYLVAFSPFLAKGDTSAIEDDSTVQESQSSMFYVIDTMIVVNGAIKYRDFSFENAYEYDITEIIAITENYRSDSSIAKITSYGKLNEKGKYNAIMTVNPLHPLDFTIDFAVEGFQMEDISPFALYYAGHPVFEGELIYSGKTVVNRGIMDSQNKITVYELQVGDKVRKNALYAMPLKFAVFLLKDKNGVVNLDIPMEGNMEDPKFKIGPLIWQIIKQNAAKVVSAPGRALASQFGMNPEELRYVDFQMLDSILTDSARLTLDHLVRLSNEKPGLLVDLKYYQPSDEELTELALLEAKKFYAQTKLGIKEEEKLQSTAKKLSNDDEYFLTFINEKLEAKGKPADSLSVIFIGMDNLVGKLRQIQKERESMTIEYINGIDSTAVNKFSFSESDYIPDFPVSRTGYLVEFGIE